MKFFTDHYFNIGSRHYKSGKPCQDYALSGGSETVACAIVSDGCSTGGNTDVGSRVLALSTLRAIREHQDHEEFDIFDKQKKLLETAREELYLETADMLATCVYVYLTEEFGAICIQGDGVVAVKFRNGSLVSHKFEWAKNAPFYIAYSDADAKVYVENIHGGKKEDAVMSQSTIVTNSEGKVVEEFFEETSFDESKKGKIIRLTKETLLEIDFIAVFSDGITQIGKLTSSEFEPWSEAVSDFLAFKNFEGEFAKRRMIRELRNLEKNSLGPVDDIAYAVVRIDHDEAEEAT